MPSRHPRVQRGDGGLLGGRDQHPERPTPRRRADGGHVVRVRARPPAGCATELQVAARRALLGARCEVRRVRARHPRTPSDRDGQPVLVDGTPVQVRCLQRGLPNPSSEVAQVDGAVNRRVGGSSPTRGSPRSPQMGSFRHSGPMSCALAFAQLLPTPRSDRLFSVDPWEAQ